MTCSTIACGSIWSARVRVSLAILLDLSKVESLIADPSLQWTSTTAVPSELVGAPHEDGGLLNRKALREEGARVAEFRLASRRRHGPVPTADT